MNSYHTTNEADEADDMRAEYDFANMKGAVRGKYVKGFEGKVTTVLLDSDVAEIFSNSASVNEALRTLARVLRRKEESAQQ
jgi:hypothetical protein